MKVLKIKTILKRLKDTRHINNKKKVIMNMEVEMLKAKIEALETKVEILTIENNTLQEYKAKIEHQREKRKSRNKRYYEKRKEIINNAMRQSLFNDGETKTNE